jgi:peptidyl-prolyl cis-trans isomerase A (cyclophilin A)
MLRQIFITMTICMLTIGIASAARAESNNPVVLMKTSLGNIKIELFQKESPITVNNFISYVKSGFYNDTIFHRVIQGFMVQGGGFTADLKIKPASKPIKNEAANGLRNDRGTIAMARTAVPDSATSQFFINTVNNDKLNRPLPDGHGYAVFGKVIEGMDVADKISAVRTGMRMGFQDVPLTPVVIKSISIVK